MKMFREYTLPQIKKSPSCSVSYYYVVSFNYILLFASGPLIVEAVEVDLTGSESLRSSSSTGRQSSATHEAIPSVEDPENSLVTMHPNQFPLTLIRDNWRASHHRRGPSIPSSGTYASCDYSAALWGLRSSKIHVIRLRYGKDTWTECITTRKSLFPNGADCPEWVLDADLIERTDADRLILSQGEERFLLLVMNVSPLSDEDDDEGNDEKSTKNRMDGALSFHDIMCTIFYRGLFLLPPSDESIIWALPNPPDRYALDFTNMPDPTLWRKSRKVKRVMKSGRYVTRLCNTVESVHASLKRAMEYHEVQNNGTWLSDSFCRALCRVRGTHRRCHVEVLCVEIIDVTTNAVVAGCCGISCGSVYEDFTMYTSERSVLGLGTFCSKLLGEALHHCGYNMWYWGFKLPYMEEFDKYGGREMKRDEFMSRWVRYRDVSPTDTLEAFLKSGQGLLPYCSDHLG